MKSKIITLAISTFLLPLSVADNSPNSLKLNFNIKRGSSRDSLSPIGHTKPRFVKRDDDVEGSAEMELVNEKTFYYANLYIGSNEDETQVLVDTGSSDLWVMSHDLECYAGYGKRKREAKNVAYVGSGPKFIEDIEDKNQLSNPTRTKAKAENQNGSFQNKAKRASTITASPKAGADSEPTNGPKKDAYYYYSDYSDTDYYSVYYLSDNSDSDYYSAYNYYSDYSDYAYYSDYSDAPYYSDYSYESYYGGYATCTSYGSFNTENSDSFVRNDTDGFDISYADGTFASGIWGRDTVKVGDLTVKDLSFAVANESSSDVGVLGIGLPGLEVTYDRSGYMYENLPLKMKSDGVIKKALYSLYLNEADDETGSILFGAVDHAKYVDTLETLELRNTYSEYDFPVKFDVQVDKIAVTKDSKTKAKVLTSAEGVVLDSGSTLSYLRSDQIDKIGEALGGEYLDSASTYKVDCDYLNDSSTALSITFGNKTISVPISGLILESTYGTTCYLGLFTQSSSTPYILFGDNILRHAYVVYNLEDNEVHIGQVYYTDDEDIEVVEESVSTGGGQSSTKAGGTSSQTSSSSSSGKKNGALSVFTVSWSLIAAGLMISFATTL
ncbi:SAP9 [Candida metapsilosis]|uniref:candidapepsin n=1 Tax=Candida metapsilosis TaxID=273372 RepID=A0A8H7ZG51_9ASCO|nr:SAP9 [Candida metapsilosis]